MQCLDAANIDSFRLRRDSHNLQPRVKPTSLRVSLKTRTLICPIENTQWCDWWPWKAEHSAAKMLFELLPVIEWKGKFDRECQKEVLWERERGRFGSAREEEEEDRCIRLCSTDVETSSVSVEGKRKFAVRRAGLPAASVQLSLYIALLGFKSQIRMCFEAFSTSRKGFLLLACVLGFWCVDDGKETSKNQQKNKNIAGISVCNTATLYSPDIVFCTNYDTYNPHWL